MGNGGAAGGRRLGAMRAALGAVFALLAGAVAAPAAECRDDQVSVRGDFGEWAVTVEVADDVEERAMGLMHRTELARNAGMIFVYPKPKVVRFWMKDTLIPLDMLFADDTGTIRYIHHEAEPGNLNPIFGGNNIQYVLEINGGLAREMGITKGSVLRHPAIAGEKVVWPC